MLGLAALPLLAPGPFRAPDPLAAQAAVLVQDEGSRGPATPHLSVADVEGGLEMRADGELFTVYHFADPEAQKPYLYPLIGPGGVELTRGYPVRERPHEARDHPHHRSVWFAHGDVNGHDFWAGKETRIVQDGPLTLTQAGSSLLVSCRNRWLAGDGALVCSEERTIGFTALEHGRTIDFDVRLRPAGGPLTFGDTKEGTMAIRMAPELRLKGEVAKGRARNAAGDEDGACWGQRARWITYWAPIGEKLAGIAIFDHPENHAHPTWWHAREYGLCAANPFGVHDFEKRPAHTGDLVVPPDGELRLRYRFLLYSGEPDEELLEAHWRTWAGVPEDGER